jgi:hypothetical protein
MAGIAATSPLMASRLTIARLILAALTISRAVASIPSLEVLLEKVGAWRTHLAWR